MITWTGHNSMWVRFHRAGPEGKFSSGRRRNDLVTILCADANLQRAGFGDALNVLGLPGKRHATEEAKENAANDNGAQPPHLIPGMDHPSTGRQRVNDGSRHVVRSHAIGHLGMS